MHDEGTIANHTLPGDTDVETYEPEPVVFTKGSPEYLADRENKLGKRVEDAKKREAELKAQLDEEMAPVLGEIDKICDKQKQLRINASGFETEAMEIDANIEQHKKTLAGLKSEIARLENRKTRISNEVLPGLSREKMALDAEMVKTQAKRDEINKKWKRKLHEVEREFNKLSLRLTRVQLRRPK